MDQVLSVIVPLFCAGLSALVVFHALDGREHLERLCIPILDTLTVWLDALFAAYTFQLKKRPDYAHIAVLECETGLWQTGLTCWSCGRISIRNTTPVPRGVQSPCVYCGMAAMPSIISVPEPAPARSYDRPPLLLPTGNELPARKAPRTIALTEEQGPELIAMRWAEHLIHSMRVPTELLQPEESPDVALASQQVETFNQAVRRRYGIASRTVLGNPHGKRIRVSDDRSLTAQTGTTAVTAQQSKEVVEDAGREIIRDAAIGE